jgi:hypothetical protein
MADERTAEKSFCGSWRINPSGSSGLSAALFLRHCKMVGLPDFLLRGPRSLQASKAGMSKQRMHSVQADANCLGWGELAVWLRSIVVPVSSDR